MKLALEYRNPDFWAEFQRSYWRKKPVVLRQPFKVFPFRTDHIRDGINALKRNYGSGSRKFRSVNRVNKDEVDTLLLLQALFPDKGSKFEEAESNFRARFSEELREVGLMINNIQSANPEIWRGATAFLQDLYRQVGFPCGGAFMDLFFGNCKSSLFGLHKDTQEIFAFVTSGKKTMYAWPFETLAPHVSDAVRDSPNLSHHLGLDYKKFVDTAVRLDAEPGDLIYWPSEYWHIAESDGASFSSMLSLGVFLRPDDPIDFRAGELPGHRGRLAPRLHPSAASGHAGNVAQLVQEIYDYTKAQDNLIESIAARELVSLGWISASGFVFGPHVDEPEFPRSLGKLALQDTDLVELAPGTTLHELIAADGSQLIAVNGLVLKLRPHERYPTLLEALRQEGKKSVRTLTSPFETAREEVMSWAYYCDQRGNNVMNPVRFKNRRDEARWVLGCIFGVGG